MKIAQRGGVVGRALNEFGMVVSEWNRHERLDPATADREQVAAAGRIVAHKLGQAVFGTEHVLIGVIRDETSSAARILARWGVDPATLAAHAIKSGHLLTGKWKAADRRCR